MTATLNSRRRWTVFALLAATIVVADQLTKAWIVANIAPGRAINIVGDWLRLVFVRNSGGIFGLFGDSAVILGLASTVVIALIVLYEARQGIKGPFLLTVALGLLLGGAVGNLIDRLRLAYVVDFVDFGIGSWRWYTFNVADSAISVALAMLIVLTLFGNRLDRRVEHSAA